MILIVVAGVIIGRRPRQFDGVAGAPLPTAATPPESSPAAAGAAQQLPLCDGTVALPPWASSVGTVLAWSSNTVFICARLPQIFKNWRRRWIVLRADRTITWQRDEASTAVRGMLALDGAQLHFGSTGQHGGGVMIRSQDGRELTLQMESEAELDQWAAALRAAAPRGEEV